MIDEGAVDKTKVHHFRRFGEMEIVAVAPATEAVGALEEFVADACAPLGGERRDVRNVLKMTFLRVIAANDHGKSILKAERLGDFEMEAVGVELLDAIVNGRGIALRGFVEDGGQRGAGVFDVEIELASEECLVDEKRAAKIRLSDDGNAGFGFDVLREELGEHDL